MAGLISVFRPPTSDPLHFLVLGYLVLAVGLVWLTHRRPQMPMASDVGSRRALLYILVYAVCVTCFWRVLSPALLGREHSSWLLALGDVVFITLGMFAWVMKLAEPTHWREYGFHMDGAPRAALTLSLGRPQHFDHPAILRGNWLGEGASHRRQHGVRVPGVHGGIGAARGVAVPRLLAGILARGGPTAGPG
jgi:hypothetical protein